MSGQERNRFRGVDREDVIEWMMSRRNFSRHRNRGISSDALELFAIGALTELTPRQYPRDPSDLAACERTYRTAPTDLQARMLPVLVKFRRAVLDGEHPDRPADKGYRDRVEWLPPADDEAELREAWGFAPMPNLRDLAASRGTTSP